MASYNLLLADLTCPRCSYTGTSEAEFRFGLLDFRRYTVGDRLEWGEKGLRFPTSRPRGGTYRGDAYVECPDCHKDYWAVILVQGDIITSIDPAPDRAAYIP